MTGLSHSTKPGLFYGYWIVAAAFLVAMVFSGCGFYAFSLFVTPLQADLGWGRGEIMIALTIYFLTSGISAPFVGRIVDRIGATRVMTAGALVAGTGFILLSLVTELWQFYGSYLFTGMGMAATGIVSTTTVVSNWFEKRRGTAIGIMSAGLGAGGLILAPLIGGYLIPGLGWRTAFRVLAGFVWALAPVALLVIKTRPADMGLFPDGREGPEENTVDVVPVLSMAGLTTKMAVATPVFWLIAVSFLAHGFSEISVLQNQVPYLEDTGFPVAMAAGILGAVGLWSTIGKFAFGWLCDRLSAKYVCAIGLSFQLAGTLVLMNVSPDSPGAVPWLYALIIGLGVGSWLPTMSMLVSTNFGLVSYGAIFGMISFSQSIGGATGPLLAGYMYDASGTYQQVFLIWIASYCVSLLSILLVRRPARPQI
jgi:MFS family permease